MGFHLEFNVSRFLENFHEYFPHIEILESYDKYENCVFLYHKSKKIETEYEDVVNEMLNVFFYDEGFYNICLIYSPLHFNENRNINEFFQNFFNESWNTAVLDWPNSSSYLVAA